MRSRQGRHGWRAVAAWAFCLSAGLTTGLAATGAAAQDLDSRLREQVLQVPAAGFTAPELEVTVYRPPGDGPHPVVVINHGRAPGPSKLQPRYRPVLAAREFVQRGWAVVVPMRQGFAGSGGGEISGGCNVRSNGEQQAVSVRRTLDWLATQPWADLSRHIVLGQSAGGLTTLAYGTAPHPATKLLVNFAGGLRQEGCLGWQRNLVAAYADYGAATRLPSLWFYGDNDSFFAPEVWREGHRRYVAAGGAAELVAFGAFGSDAHALFGSRAGLAVWVPPLMARLDALGLPTAVLHRFDGPADIPAPPASGFARVDEAERVPLRSERAREGYARWLAAEAPKAFAVQPDTGAWGSAWGGERPNARALANCARHARGQACKLYAVDDTVVWTTNE